jgi:hypothetical protein
MLMPLALFAAPAAAQTPISLTPEEAATLDRTMTRPPGLPAPCTGTGAGNEIVVCAHREKPIEFEREPGEIVRHINEPGFGTDALAADHCTRLCDVGVTVNLIAAARAVPKIVRHILGRD